MLLNNTGCFLNSKIIVKIGVKMDPDTTVKDDEIEQLISTLISGSRNQKRKAAKSLGKIGDQRALKPLFEVWKNYDLYEAKYAIEKIRERDNIDFNIDFKHPNIKKPVNKKRIALFLTPIFAVGIILLIIFSFSSTDTSSDVNSDIVMPASTNVQPVVAKRNLTESEYESEIQAIVNQQLVISDDLEKTYSEFFNGQITANDVAIYNQGDIDAIGYVQDDLDEINPPSKYKNIHQKLNSANNYLSLAVDTYTIDLNYVREARMILLDVNDELNLGL